MQYSVVKFKEVLVDNDIFRFDADYFYPKSYNLYKTIKNKKHARVKESFNVTKLAGFEYTKYFTDPNINSDNYYIVLTSKNIQNEELVLSEFLKIDKKIADEFLKRSKLNRGDVVLSYTGEYRRALVLEESDFQLGPNICLVRSKNKNINPYYLSTFLNSGAGQLLLDREKTLSAQPTVAMSRIREIPIPVLDIDFQNQIGEIIASSKIKRKSANDLYSQAEQLLLSELGLLDWKPKHELAFVKNFSDTQKAERFDAEYFQPKYEEIIEAVKKYKGGFDELGNLVKIKDKNFTPKDNEQYKYIELANISSNGEINGYTENFGNELPSRARRKVQRGDLIVSSIEGSLESIALITEDWKNALCSTGFFAVNSDKINSETLLVLLKTKVGQLQLKKGCKGTILTAIGKDELSKIVLPKIDSKTQEEIKKKIAEMYETKKLSKSLLEIAKQGVEMAIEKDEQEAEKWIEGEVEKLEVKIQ